MTKIEFESLGGQFLLETEKKDEGEPLWYTKNHVPTLFDSLNEFYLWLEINYWQENKNDND